MAKQKTRYPGVTALGNNQYRVRVSWMCKKTGSQKSTKRVVTAESLAEASATRSALLAEVKVEVESRPRTRVEDYAHSWLRSKLTTLKPSTAQRYATTLDLHILPTFGQYFLDAVEHRDIIEWRNEQSGEAKPATVNSWLRILKTMFKNATDEYALMRDPAANVPALPARNSADDPNSLTSEQLDQLLTAIQALDQEGIARSKRWNDKRLTPRKQRIAQHLPFFLLLAYTGMRVGEATALRWSDINEHAMEIRVVRAQWRGKVGTTKTDSVRTVPLHPELQRALLAHRQRLLAEQAPGLVDGWVFPSRRTGKLMSTTAFRKPLLAALQRAQLDLRFTVHGFRRTFNNLVRRATKDGVVVRAMTGHVSESMTEHYSHVDTCEKTEAVLAALKGKKD